MVSDIILEGKHTLHHASAARTPTHPFVDASVGGGNPERVPAVEGIQAEAEDGGLL